MPDIAGLRTVSGIRIDGIADGSNRMDLIRTQHDERLALAVEHGIHRNHLMRRRDGEHLLGKGEIV